MLRTLLRFLARQPKGLVLLLAVALVFFIFAVDYVTGTDIAVFLFYWIPIALAAWRGRLRSGILIALLCDASYVAANYRIAAVSGPLVLYWNAAIRLGSYVITAALVAEVKLLFDRLHELAQTDPLTGAYNARAFYRIAEEERARGQRYRHALTVAYMDIDNFKTVNDAHGHGTGDALLIAVARTLRSHLRRSDVLARMGGDEFAILLPEADARSARQAFTKLEDALRALAESQGWPVTFSIGVVTYEVPPGLTETMVQAADHLMYSVKNGTKNGIAFAVEPGPGSAQRGSSSVSSAV
ncbi:MAG TPA: GGDEF domain-containing protein [Terriglobales bacterium]|nr:GGDEF domain-containing protein [Terriglobales bacterium]